MHLHVTYKPHRVSQRSSEGFSFSTINPQNNYHEHPLLFPSPHPLDFKSIVTLPNSHTWAPSSSDHHPFPDSVPVIDLSDPNAIATPLVLRAYEKWGVFQVTNHGVPMNLIKQTQLQTHRLFALPRDQKLRVLSSPDGFTGYGSARISYNIPNLIWSEGFSMTGSPLEHARQLWPRHHANFCNVMEEYQKEMKGLAAKLIELMLRSLGLNNEDVKWFRHPQYLLQLNSYPVCPDPTRAMGLGPPRTDSSLLTLLYQTTTSGLQVLVDGVLWAPVCARRQRRGFNARTIQRAFQECSPSCHCQQSAPSHLDRIRPTMVCEDVSVDEIDRSPSSTYLSAGNLEGVPWLQGNALQQGT